MARVQRKSTNLTPFRLKLIPRAEAGGPTVRVDGIPTWDTTGLTLSATAADGMSVEVAITGTVGVVQASVTFDADLGGGVRSLVETIEVETTVQEPEATEAGSEVVAEELDGTPLP